MDQVEVAIEHEQDESLNNALKSTDKEEIKVRITFEEFENVCRTCITKHKEIRPIRDVLYGDISAGYLLETYTSIQINENDYLPQNICNDCVDVLIRFHKFREKCQYNENVLKSIYDNKESSNVNEDIDEVLEDGNDIEDKASSRSIHKTNFRKVRMLRKDLSRKSILNGPPYKCRDCELICDTRNELKEHRKTVKHTENRTHACSICGKMFTNSKLRQHMRAHTKEKPYVCKICDQGFSMSGNLKRHMMTHTGERPHVCEICGKGFIQATTLVNHRKTHLNSEKSNENNSPNFICNYCGRGFKRLARYNAHINRHYSDDGSNSVSKKDESGEEEVKEYICDICKRSYKTKHLLKAHQLTHGEKTFLCSNCGKGFVTKAALQSHLKVHTGEKPHTCTVCKKSFAHVGSFEAHMLIHTGQKPYRCKECTKSFTQLSHLKYHLRTHSGERPYICSYCGKSFALKGNLTVHIRIHTGETPYTCTICSKGFYDSSSMKKHQRGHGEISVVPTTQNVPSSVPVIGGVAYTEETINLVTQPQHLNTIHYSQL